MDVFGGASSTQMSNVNLNNPSGSSKLLDEDDFL